MFEFEFPLFILVRQFTLNPKGELEFHDVVALTGAGVPTAIALFTDLPAAEQYRDENAPQHQVFPIEEAMSLVVVFHSLSRQYRYAAFDPFRAGLQVQIAAMEDLIRQFHSP